MSPIDIETKRKLREMNAADLLAAIEAQDETLSMALAFEERVRLVVDEAYSAFTHSKITGLLRRAQLRYPNADLRAVDRIEERGLERCHRRRKEAAAGRTGRLTQRRFREVVSRDTADPRIERHHLGGEWRVGLDRRDVHRHGERHDQGHGGVR